jgi:hypothetical protein
VIRSASFGSRVAALRSWTRALPWREGIGPDITVAMKPPYLHFPGGAMNTAFITHVNYLTGEYEVFFTSGQSVTIKGEGMKIVKDFLDTNNPDAPIDNPRVR